MYPAQTQTLFKFPYHILGLQGGGVTSLLPVLLVSLVYLGWGRGGLLGGGSRIVALGEDLALWGSPRGLDLCWKRLLFFSFFLFPFGFFSGGFLGEGFLGVMAVRGWWLLVSTGSLP